MENNRPNLIIISISMMYWFKTSVDCWKFDGARFTNNNNGGGGGGGGSTSKSSHENIINNNANKKLNKNNNNIGNGVNINNNNNKGLTNLNNALNTYQDILYACPLNSMCQCASLPNESSTLIEMNCNDIELYKFPEFLQSSIRYIDMSRTSLQNIDDETFQGLKLETLKLVDNKLQHISQRSFWTMSHTLMTLDISGNQLQYLPLEALRNLHSLNRLVVQRNYITTLDGNWGCLSDSLRSLHISGNKITEINSGTNHDDNNKRSIILPLDIESNGIATIIPTPASPSSLLGLSSSSSVSISTGIGQGTQTQTGIGIGTASSSILESMNFNHIQRPFSKLRKLIWLDISNNRIHHINSNYLPRSLITIDLSKNLLTTLPQHFFEHLLNIKILSLRDNLIKLITFRDLLRSTNMNVNVNNIQLEKLDLSMNLIDDLQLFDSNHQIYTNFNRIYVRALNLEKNFIKIIPENGLQNFHNIIHLVLAFNDIENIHQNAFNHINHTLEYLDLECNELKYLPNAIKSLNKLKYLYLTSNNIEYLTNLPNSTTQLHVLSLSGNNFTQIPQYILKKYTKLTYLNLGYNSINDISENIFQNWGHNIQTLLLRNNKITTLQLNTFNDLNSIQEISLSFNDIIYINPLIFQNISLTLKILELSFSIYRNDEFPYYILQPLHKLLWLSLDNNNIKTIQNVSFLTLTELTYINLSFNQIKFIPVNLFQSHIHQNLIDINLSYNLITNLTSYTFFNLLQLQIINLQSNYIQIIEKFTFYKLMNLRFLDLSYNQLKYIHENAFDNLPLLENLNLISNLLHKISLKMFHYISYNTSIPLIFNISQNLIQNFDDSFSSYLSITKLDLNTNYIQNLKSFNNLAHTLKILYLNYNNITILNNHAFGDLYQLEILILSNNMINSIRRRCFQGLNNLQTLDLSSNYIEQLQIEQFSNLKKLRYLKLNHNKLRTLPRDVFMNTRLEYLDISNNLLTIWPVLAFTDIGFTLRIIYISNNLIEYLDSQMFINTQFLFHINISNNKLKLLPDNTFIYLNNLTYLDISYNPLNINNLNEIFLYTLNIRYLYMININLLILPYLNLSYLTHLDISYNYITNIYSLKHLNLLRILNLSNNKIINISQIIENLPINSIKILNLSNNPIRRFLINDMILLKNLDELNLLNIKIFNSMIFMKLRSLRKLHITSYHNNQNINVTGIGTGTGTGAGTGTSTGTMINNYNNIGEIVSRLPGLQEVYIHLTEDIINHELFMKFMNNTKLNLIDVYGPNVYTITQNAFNGLGKNHKLKIKLHHTKITDLPPSLFYSLRSIKHLTLDLSDNKITALAADSFYPNITYWDKVGTRNIIGGLDTSNNPLECECGLVWFGHWLRRWLRETAQIKVIQNDEMRQMIQRARANTCHDPTTGKKLPILEIFPEDLLCHASALSSSGEKPILLLLVSLLPIFAAFGRILL